jgi:hypothetical protein
MSRTFRALNHLTLPQGVLAGPGATNMRLDPGSVFTAEDGPAIAHSRFLNNRVRMGDLVELDAKPADAPAPKPVKSISAPATGERHLELPERPKKES